MLKLTKFVIFLTLAGCSGAPFTAEPGTSFNEAGAFSAQGGEAGANEAVVVGGAASGGRSGTAGGFGISGMAGLSGQGGKPGLSTCLAYFQNLDCARVCTNSQSDCQAVLSCYVTQNSVDNCQNFTNIGISLAQSAESACCK